ncbi:hypothetical protein [Sporomusa aerivorans]|uniref:YkvI family membrane protein n=1 Tax=Sporomusa aerivorans TaxID=204936 RepID=UPI00352AB116
MTTESVNWKKTFLLAGSLCACYMGAGFTSGQEVLQFFTSLGTMGLVSIAMSWILFIYFTYVIYKVAKEQNFNDPYDILEYYCGKILGRILVWYIVALMYGVFMIMLTGSGATINQYYGVPIYAGVWAMGILTLGTVVLGIDKLINIIGLIGPVKVLFIVIVGVPALLAMFSSPAAFLEVDKIIPTLELKKASSNWVTAGIIYPCLYVMTAIPFMVACGASATNIKESIIAGVTGISGFMFSVFMLVVAELMNIQAIVGKQVPTLVVAEKISPILGATFSVLIILCIYSTATSYLWGTVRKFAEDRTKKFYIISTVLAGIGMLFGQVIPFDVLVNTLYPISGYVGIIFLVCMIVKQLKDKYGKTNADFNG